MGRHTETLSILVADILPKRPAVVASFSEAGVDTVRDLIRMEQCEVLRLPNLGRGALKIIVGWLDERGLSLAPETEPDKEWPGPGWYHWRARNPHLPSRYEGQR